MFLFNYQKEGTPILSAMSVSDATSNQVYTLDIKKLNPEKGALLVQTFNVSKSVLKRFVKFKGES